MSLSLARRCVSAVAVGLTSLIVLGCGGSSSGGAIAAYDPVETGDTADPVPLPPVASPRQPGEPSPRVSLITCEGVILEYPIWLDRWPDQRTALLAELRSVVPEADSRIPTDVRGVPPGTTVIVLDPGAYYAPYSPTGLAAGEFRSPSLIYVAWRGTPQGTLVPALAHELRHMLTGDPTAGH